MPASAYDLHGTRVFECAAEGAELRTARDVTDLLSETWQHSATLVVIPVSRLGDDFFRLRTGIAGEVLQKFVQYRMRVAILGDVLEYVEASTAFRDFVVESNRGNHIWFVSSREHLDERLRSSSLI